MIMRLNQPCKIGGWPAKYDYTAVINSRKINNLVKNNSRKKVVLCFESISYIYLVRWIRHLYVNVIIFKAFSG